MTLRILHLDRSRSRNSLDEATMAYLREAIESARDRAIVLTAVPPAFCAGLDLDELLEAAERPRGIERILGRLVGLYLRLLRHPQPTLAIVDGPAVGGGAGLAFCFDRIIATERSTFHLPSGPLAPLAGIVPPVARRRGPVDEVIPHRPNDADIEHLAMQALGPPDHWQEIVRSRTPLDPHLMSTALREAIQPSRLAAAVQFLRNRRMDGIKKPPL